ncbi:AAA family ATPase [bacterium]|nr:AAA family ATPase [bacterium]
MIKRTLNIDIKANKAFFLLGPRKTGKTTLLHQKFPDAKYYDLLTTDLKTKLLLNPARLREEVLAQEPALVIVDEVQKVPALLDEIHWCLENTDTRFILCGSSARKLRRGAANLLGGRAWRYELFPLTTHELEETDLVRILNHGLVPIHYIQNKPEKSLRSYVLDYINEEINAEALTRNVPAFAKFLDAVALTHGELINYANIGRDCGVSPKTVREYYQILEDTLLGHTLEPWRKSKNRRLIETAKFYLFDVGVVRALKGMPLIQPRTEGFGRAFEHFLIEEIRAYLSYKEKDLPIYFWRTSTYLEVDLIIGDLDLAVEFKATDNIKSQHLKGLKALTEEHVVKKAILVCLEKEPRKVGNILILPWKMFCQNLWAGQLI